MARNLNSRIQEEPERPLNIVLDNFRGGLVTLVDQSVASSNAAVTTKNLMQVQDGRWAPRWGTAGYGTDLGGVIIGISRYVSSTGASHLVAVVNVAGTGVIKRSTDDGVTWSVCTGATPTVGKQSYSIQSNNYLYIANSADNIIRYDGSLTLLTFTALTTPTGLTLTRSAGLAAGSFTQVYRVSAINDIGETLACAAVAVTGGLNIIRDNWKNDPTAADTQYVDLSWARVPGAKRYMIYAADQSTGQEQLLDTMADPGTGTNMIYHDNGKADVTPYIVVPTQNTTQGPKFGPMELSGNRVWATKDTDNPWRVWWSGTFPNAGAFNPYYDGGYIDLEPGGAERPQNVVHYRDGKGGSFATVLTSDPEGNGSIWQISLDTVSVGNFQYVQPVPTKIVGSIGTTSPLSVVKVKNDIMFFNRKGVFTLGSKAQMLNLLSTDEISANIRPDIRGLTGQALVGVAGVYYDAKVFYAVPQGSSANSVIYVNDTERRNWSGPWTVAVNQFLVYADNNGGNHLLGVPTGGSRLIEFGEGIKGDMGAAFETVYISPLIPVNPKNRTQFAKIDRAYIELARPVGNVQFSVLGYDRKDRFSSAAAITLTGSLGDAGYSTAGFDSFTFSDTSQVAVSQSEAIVRKFIKVRRKMNNIQFKIVSFDLGVSYTLLSLQAKGFVIDSRDPSRWKA